MAFALALRKLPKAEIESRVRQAADILGLQGVLDRRPKQLSGGQRQRVAVGRAIVRQPQVFLFDEPLSNLDAKLRVQTRREIAKLHRELAATMVYVTHDQVEAMTMGDRIVVMHEGRVQQTDTPLGLYDRPVNRFVAGFIGSPAMNFVSGFVARDNGALRFRTEGDGLAFAIPEPAAGVLAGRDGKPIILGIRPEHIAVAGALGRTSPTATGLVRLRLDAVEPMGNEIILYGRAGAHDLTSRVPPQPLPATGDSVELAVDLAKLHFFDPATEMVIAQPHGPSTPADT
jgi:multiple sugar transport system ATP-binding protein